MSVVSVMQMVPSVILATLVEDALLMHNAQLLMAQMIFASQVVVFNVWTTISVINNHQISLFAHQPLTPVSYNHVHCILNVLHIYVLVGDAEPVIAEADHALLDLRANQEIASEND
jgi:hypothetical protein